MLISLNWAVMADILLVSFKCLLWKENIKELLELEANTLFVFLFTSVRRYTKQTVHSGGYTDFTQSSPGWCWESISSRRGELSFHCHAVNIFFLLLFICLFVFYSTLSVVVPLQAWLNHFFQASWRTNAVFVPVGFGCHTKTEPVRWMGLPQSEVQLPDLRVCWIPGRFVFPHGRPLHYWRQQGRQEIYWRYIYLKWLFTFLSFSWEWLNTKLSGDTVMYVWLKTV